VLTIISLTDLALGYTATPHMRSSIC